MAEGKPPARPGPTLEREREILGRGAGLLAGIDEVGRGALAGPVSVGVVIISDSAGSAPEGLRDSKLLTPAARSRVAPQVAAWALGHEVGQASPAEIDDLGIIGALRLAARRALTVLAQQGLCPEVVLLDGSHDWLSPPADSLFVVEPQWSGSASAARGSLPPAGACGPHAGGVLMLAREPRVVTLVKADLRCASVAGASVIAKVERDGQMVALDAKHPVYHWAENKGYASARHIAALRSHGASVEHRRSWRLPGVEDDRG